MCLWVWSLVILRAAVTETSVDQTTLLASAGLAVGMLGLIFALSAHRRLSSARRSLVLLQSSFDGKTIVDAVATYLAHVNEIEDRIVVQSRRQEELFALLGRSTRNLGVIRYDAFEDMGGRLSFSAAMLDDHGTGMVLTAINSRSEARVYAKPIERGLSEHNLSREEEMAIADALGGRARVSR